MFDVARNIIIKGNTNFSNGFYVKTGLVKDRCFVWLKILNKTIST